MLNWFKRRKAGKEPGSAPVLSADAEWQATYKHEGRFAEMVERYVQLARQNKSPYQRENLLGLACLYDHKPEEARDHFQRARGAAVGKSIETIGSNSVQALIGMRRYGEAWRIIEEKRRKGEHFHIASYVLLLLIQGQRDEAIAFYDLQPPVKFPEEMTMLGTIVACDPHKPESVDILRSILAEPRWMWVYVSLLRDLMLNYDAESFLAAMDREVQLEAEGTALATALAALPQFFADGRLQFLRKMVVAVLPTIKDAAARHALFEVLQGIDEAPAEANLPQDLRDAYVQFWRRFYGLYWRTIDRGRVDLAACRKVALEQLPADACTIASGVNDDGGAWSLHHSPSSGFGFWFYQSGKEVHFDLMEPSRIAKTLDNIAPAVRAVEAAPDLQRFLESEIRRGILHRPIRAEALREIAVKLEPPLRPPMLSLIAEYESREASVAGEPSDEAEAGRTST